MNERWRRKKSPPSRPFRNGDGRRAISTGIRDLGNDLASMGLACGGAATLWILFSSIQSVAAPPHSKRGEAGTPVAPTPSQKNASPEAFLLRNQPCEEVSIMLRLALLFLVVSLIAAL